MVQIVSADRIQMPNEGQLGVGFRWGNDQIVSAIIHRLPHNWHPMPFQVTMKKSENLSFLP